MQGQTRACEPGRLGACENVRARACKCERVRACARASGARRRLADVARREDVEEGAAARHAKSAAPRESEHAKRHRCIRNSERGRVASGGRCAAGSGVTSATPDTVLVNRRERRA
eukprot:6203333-Pleurochrysis_carterae.AAC.1